MSMKYLQPMIPINANEKQPGEYATLEMNLPYNLATPFLGSYSKESTYQKIYIFIVTQFVIARAQKQHRCPTSNK